MLEEDLTVGVSEHDAGLVPHGVDGLPGPLLGDLELDAVQVDIAVGLDLHLPPALTSNAGRRGDDGIGRLGAGRLGNRGGVPCLLRRDPAGTFCGRCRARHRTSSPTRVARPVATAKSPDGYGHQRDRSSAPAKSSRHRP